MAVKQITFKLGINGIFELLYRFQTNLHKKVTLANCKRYHNMYSFNPRLLHKYAEGNTTSIEIVFPSAYL